MSDFVKLGFELAFKYSNPILILSDGVIGQMMENVELFEQQPRTTTFDQSWATTGKTEDRERNIITSLDLDPYRQEKHNLKLQAKYKAMEENEIRYEEFDCDDADYIIVAYGSSARISQKAVQLARAKGIKAGLFRPITLYPFPKEAIHAHTSHVKSMLSVEMSAGQMIEDIQLAVKGKINVSHFGRYGGVIPAPDEVLEALEKLISQESK
jgi:2-oxoglutarate ferredoxin oxidoreductase subunit alpha